MKTDNEFKALIFPLTEAEITALEESLRREGCRDALVAWHGILLDGHHRLDLCRKHGITFKTAEVKLEDRAAAKAWVIKNQFARRNLTLFQRAELALRLEPLIAAEAKKRMVKGKRADPGANLPQGRARDLLGKLAGVSGKTIDFARLVVEKGTEEQKELARKDSLKLYHVASEITHKEKTRKREEEVAKERERVAAIPPEDDGWKITRYRDKWGNKCVYKCKYDDLGLGNKSARFSKSEVIEYAPGYKEADEGQADYEVQSLFDDLRNGLREATTALEKIKKYGPEKMRAAYDFDQDAPRPGWTNWGNEGGLELQPGDPPPLSIEEAKRYLWPEVVANYGKLRKAAQKIGLVGDTGSERQEEEG